MFRRGTPDIPDDPSDRHDAYFDGEHYHIDQNYLRAAQPAFLLELLSDFALSIPEIGTITAERPPLVVLTSNRTRELHDALKRRCVYHWVGYPDPERELEIVLTRAPGTSETLARKVVSAVNRLREMDLAKPPGVAETIDWVRALEVVAGPDGDTDADAMSDTLGAVVKERDDLELVRERLEEIVG